ncbi:MAG: hypothetical protein KAS12_04685 [Candidatus Aenigmarchaeota archaeon]|nr:hypothetical protein [Candidatus Aenigmarchaeota archaeon]
MESLYPGYQLLKDDPKWQELVHTFIAYSETTSPPKFDMKVWMLVANKEQNVDYITQRDAYNIYQKEFNTTYTRLYNAICQYVNIMTKKV